MWCGKKEMKRNEMQWAHSIHYEAIRWTFEIMDPSIKSINYEVNTENAPIIFIYVKGMKVKHKIK